MTRFLTPKRWVYAALALLLGVAVLFYFLTRDAQETAQTKTEEAQVEGAKADAAANTVEAICEAGDAAACRLLAQLDRAGQTETQDEEIQEPEIQEPERQEQELQEGEIPDPERQDPEGDDPELQNPETQDDEVDDPDVDQPEIQDDEQQDAELNDPDKDDPEIQDDEIQDPEVDDPDPDDPEQQDPEVDDPDPASPFTFTFVFTVPSDIPGRPGTTYTVTCNSGTGACTVA